MAYTLTKEQIEQMCDSFCIDALTEQILAITPQERTKARQSAKAILPTTDEDDRLDQLEAENLRLREQIKLLTKTP